MAITGYEPSGIAIDVGKRAKTVVLQLEEPIRMGKGKRPTDERERLNMRQRWSRLLLSHGTSALVQIPYPGRRYMAATFFR